MKFSLIICTYQRKEAIEQLLNSVTHQTLYPSEILVVDGSIDTETQTFIEASSYKNLHYFLVEATNRGLTKQRNFGISKVAIDSEIVCFLDDDTILAPTYFQELLKTYRIKPDALAVGGYITNEVKWSNAVIKNGYCIDGYCRKESVRFQLRKKLGLIDNTPPGFMPAYSHGRSIGHIPPSNKVYSVEFFMGGVASYKKEVVDKIQFSTYFEGYGLYEDLDFCLRVAKLGNLYVNTAAQLAHHHHEAGRPNKYKYGKMVVRNGWYVWRVKYPKPTLKAKLLFHLNVIVLLKLRFINSITGSNKKEAFTEALGRLVGWFSLFLNKPK
jgi:glycosyltransferase involved in cell wall biosynthesis